MRRFYTQRRKFKKLGVIDGNSDSEDQNEDDNLESKLGPQHLTGIMLCVLCICIFKKIMFPFVSR